jgi:hypothetical protein
MRRFLPLATAFALCLGLLGYSASPASAACSVSLRYTLYEDPNFHSSGTDPFIKCGSDNTLTDNYATPDFDCLAPLILHETWNDCASSWKFIGSCHYGVTMYADANYGGTVVWSRWGNGGTQSFSGGLGYEDMISSIRWNYRTTCPSF